MNAVNRIMTQVYFFSALVLTLWVFFRVKMRLDPAMVIIVLAYLLSFAFRLPYLSGQGMNFLTGASQVLIFGLL